MTNVTDPLIQIRPNTLSGEFSNTCPGKGDNRDGDWQGWGFLGPASPRVSEVPFETNCWKLTYKLNDVRICWWSQTINLQTSASPRFQQSWKSPRRVWWVNGGNLCLHLTLTSSGLSIFQTSNASCSETPWEIYPFHRPEDLVILSSHIHSEERPNTIYFSLTAMTRLYHWARLRRTVSSI